MLLAKEALIGDIRSALAVFQDYVRPGGKLNLTDLNVQSEDFVAGLLNAVFGWALVGTNKIKANYQCIDLIDESRKLGVQVTAEGGSDKLTGTLECLEKHKMAREVSQLKVFLLIQKQGKYTVNAACPGIAFDWKADVLDCDDVCQAAQAIGELDQLRRVHRFIVESMPRLFPDYGPARPSEADEPPLGLPATDPSISWLAFSSRATQLVGRTDELSQLKAFINSGSRFSWHLLMGTGGTGKSRLALELCRECGPEWHTGFLNRAKQDFDWSRFRPSRKTLVVIDYVASRAAKISEVILTLSRSAAHYSHPIRVLLVERNKGSWWPTFFRDESQSESAEIAACQHGEPLRLKGLSGEAILDLAGEVVGKQKRKWNDVSIINYMRLLRTVDPRGRPLFAMIAAAYLDNAGTDTPANTDLLQRVLTKEAGRRKGLIPDPERLKRMENLLLLSTLVSGLLSKSNGFDYLATSNVAKLLPEVELIDHDIYSDIAGSDPGGSYFAGLQPDLLGERYLLDRLTAPGLAGESARRLLVAAWSFQPDDFGVVAIRTASDFQGDPGLFKLFDLPLDSGDARGLWGEVVGDLVAVIGQSADPLSRAQLQKLIDLADMHREETRLQQAAARAEYNLASTYLFDENDLPNAAKGFEAAIARAGPTSLIAKMAIHNRGILHDRVDETDKAFADFTTMIEAADASDEMRACGLNNRADIFAERGEYENAIRDRSAVLALGDTSADRRFIALFRRSHSYSALGNPKAAVDDLNQILKVPDISPHQKVDAILARGVILRRHKQYEQAIADLEFVIGAKYTFEGTRAIALVERARVAREMKAPALASSYLVMATDDLDAFAETLVDALIVRAQLMEDAANTNAAAEIWRSILSHPNSTQAQRALAQTRISSRPDGALVE